MTEPNFLRADMQILMDQLRQQAPNTPSWDELTKMARANFMEKRNPLDAEDRAQIQQSLDILRKNVTVSSSRDLFETLAHICAKINFKTQISADQLTIAHDSDLFLINIFAAKNLDQNKEENLVDLCEIIYPDRSKGTFDQLKQSLNSRQWNSTEKLLVSSVSAFMLNPDKNVNLEIFKMMTAFENLIKNASDHTGKQEKALFHEELNLAEFGCFRPRNAVEPARLHFFVTPESMVNLKTKEFWEPSALDFFSDPKGIWTELFAETTPIYQNLSINLYENQQNSKSLPAKFTLRFNENLIISLGTLTKLSQLSGCEVETSNHENCIKLLLLHEAQVQISDLEEFYVILSDQCHRYAINSIDNPRLVCSLLSKIRFTNAHHIGPILKLIRSDLIFTQMLKSCMKKYSTKVEKRKLKFAKNQSISMQVSSSDFGRMEILCEFPGKEGVFLSVKFIIGDSLETSNLQLSLLGADIKVQNQEEYATRIFRKFLSAPVTIRAILRKLLGNNPSDWAIQNYSTQNDDDDDSDESSSSSDDDDDKYPGNQKRKFDTTSSKSENGIFHDDKRIKTESLQLAPMKGELKFQTLRIIARPIDQAQALAFVEHFDEKALSRNLPNMLDLFKDLDEWDELIPPRANQKPLHSPAPYTRKSTLTNQQSHHHQYGAPPTPATGPPMTPTQGPMTPVSTSVFGQQQYVGQPMSVPPGTPGTSRSPKARHMSTTSDTYGELEQLLTLSRSFQSEQAASASGNQASNASVGCATPSVDSDSFASSSCTTTPVTADRAPLVAVGCGGGLERKSSSVQDTIDSVVMSTTIVNNQNPLMMTSSSSACRVGSPGYTGIVSSGRAPTPGATPSPLHQMPRRPSSGISGGGGAAAAMDFGPTDFIAGQAFVQQQQNMAAMMNQQQQQQQYHHANMQQHRNSMGSSSLDVFDFDKSEQSTMSVYDNSAILHHRYSTSALGSYGGEPATSSMMGFNPDASMPAGSGYVGVPGSQLSPVAAPSYQLVRGGGGAMVAGVLPRGGGTASQRRRRSRRNLANMGDRNFEQALKQSKKAMVAAEKAALKERGMKAPRRPRRPRGANILQSGVSPHMVDSTKVRTKYYSGGEPSSPENSTGDLIGPSGRSSSLTMEQQYQHQISLQQSSQQFQNNQQGQQQQQVHQQQYDFSPGGNMTALKDMMSSYGTDPSSFTKDFGQSSQHSAVSNQINDSTLQQQQQQSSESTLQPSYKPADNSSNFRRQIHAVIQETMYSNPANRSTSQNPESDLSVLESLHSGMHNLRKSESADEVFHQMIDNSGKKTELILENTMRSSTPGSAENLFENLSRSKERMGTMGDATLQHGSDVGLQRTQSTTPPATYSSSNAGNNGSSFSKRKGSSLDDVIGKLTAGVYRCQSTGGASNIEDSNSQSRSMVDEERCSTNSSSSGADSASTGGASVEVAHHMAMANKRPRIDDDHLDSVAFRYDSSRVSLSDNQQSRSTPPVAPPPKAGSVEQLLQQHASSSSEASPATSLSGAASGGQPLKLVIRKKDLKLPPQQPQSLHGSQFGQGSTDGANNASTLARSILSAKLAKAAAESGVSAQQRILNMQQQLQQLQSQKRASPSSVENLRQSQLPPLTVQQLMMRQSQDEKVAKLQQAGKQAAEKRAKKLASITFQQGTTGLIGSSRLQVQASIANVTSGSNLVPVGNNPSDSPKITAKLLEKGLERKLSQSSTTPVIPQNISTEVTPTTAGPIFAGTDGGIFVSKSLTGYKIPRIEEKLQTATTTISPQVVTVVTTQSMTGTGSIAPITLTGQPPVRKPPFQPSYSPAVTRMPKPILKQSKPPPQPQPPVAVAVAAEYAQSQPQPPGSMMQSFASKMVDPKTAFHLAKRRPLLPDPSKFGSGGVPAPPPSSATLAQQHAAPPVDHSAAASSNLLAQQGAPTQHLVASQFGAFLPMMTKANAPPQHASLGIANVDEAGAVQSDEGFIVSDEAPASPDDD